MKGWRRWPGSWPGPAAWIRTGNFDRGKRGTGAEARPSRTHRPQAAPRCAGRTGAPGRNGRSRPRPPAGSGQTWAGGRFADLGADLGPAPRWWPWCPAGRIMDEGRPEPPPRPRIRAQGGPSGKVKGWRCWPDHGRGLPHGSGQGILTGASGAPGRNGRSRPVFLQDRGSRGAGGRFAGLGPDLGPVPRWWRGAHWPDHGRRTPGAAATAPDQGTGRPVRQGEGVAALAGIVAVACCMDQDREF